VYAGNNVFFYKVTTRQILKERDQPLEVRLKNAQWIQPTSDERLTLVTCWPYTTNTHRLIIVAKPIAGDSLEGKPTS
jgi:sortase A